MSKTKSLFNPQTLPEETQQALQRKATEWGVPLQEVCLMLLAERVDEIEGRRAPAQPNFFARLFGFGRAH